MARIMKQGKCGDNLTWTLDNEGLLTISGEGKMNNYFSGLPFFPDSPFKNNTNITKVKISHGVTSIGNEAFSECEALTSIEIPNSVTSIGNYAFLGCKALTSIEIPNLVTSIGWSAFDGCEALEFNEYGKELYLGNKENPYAFLIKTKSTDITACSIKDTCKIIGYRAFSRCEALTSIEIPNSVTKIGEYAFAWCKALTSIKIPNSVTSIGDSAFLGCEALTSINIPNSVTEIEDDAFLGCKALTSIEVAEDNENYDSIDGVLYDKEKKTLIQCPGGKNNIEIPNSVTKIGEYAFEGCTALTSIHIRCEHPEDLEIETNAFNDTPIENCTLHVPAGTEDAYRAHPVFGKFKEVVTEK